MASENREAVATDAAEHLLTEQPAVDNTSALSEKDCARKSSASACSCGGSVVREGAAGGRAAVATDVASPRKVALLSPLIESPPFMNVCFVKVGDLDDVTLSADADLPVNAELQSPLIDLLKKEVPVVAIVSSPGTKEVAADAAKTRCEACSLT